MLLDDMTWLNKLLSLLLLLLLLTQGALKLKDQPSVKSKIRPVRVEGSLNPQI